MHPASKPAEGFGLFRPTNAQDGDPATKNNETTADDDELELRQPIDPADLDAPQEAEDDKAAGSTDTSAAPDAKPPSAAASDDAKPVVVEVPVHEMPLEIDDDDDLDDFDELLTIGGRAQDPPPPSDTTSFFPDIDLDDSSLADELEVPPPPPRAAQEIMKLSAAIKAEANADADSGAEHPKQPLRSPSKPVAKSPPTRPESEESGESAAKLDEAPIRPLDASLSLQPIPELQSKPRAPLQTRAKTLDGSLTKATPAENKTDVPDGPPHEQNPDSLPTERDESPVGVWDLEPSDTDEPPRNEADDSDERDDHPGGIVTLSTTLSQIAASGESALEVLKPDQADPLSHPLARTTPQRKPEGQLPTTLPASSGDFSPAQLSFGIIANVPRLRRLAAAQVGEELEADRLVQITIRSALADPSVLQPPTDLGQALIMLLHQHRQEMVSAPTALPRLAEAAHAFEAALCRALAGADQFETQQFARAINGLDEPDRNILLLVSLENFAYSQIADILQAPAEWVMPLISGARMRLRQALAADEAAADTPKPKSEVPHPQEIEIHGYLDGELDSHHMADVDALIEKDQDAADRLLQYGIQGDLIRRLYAPLLNRPIPGAMLEVFSEPPKSSPPRRVFPFGPRKALATGAVALALGAAAAWMYGAPTASDFSQRTASLTEQHQADHSVT